MRKNVLSKLENDAYNGCENKVILKQAFKHYDSLLKKNPQDFDAHFYMSLVCLRLNKLEQALNHALHVKKHNPSEENINLNIGCIYHAKKNDGMAIRYYKKEVSLHKNNTEALFNLGEVYFIKHKYLNAISYLQKAFDKKHVRDRYAIVEMLGESYQKLKRYSDEIKIYQKYLKEEPKNGLVLQNLGATYIDIGQFKKAIYYSKLAKKYLKDKSSVNRNIALAERCL